MLQDALTTGRTHKTIDKNMQLRKLQSATTGNFERDIWEDHEPRHAVLALRLWYPESYTLFFVDS